MALPEYHRNDGGPWKKASPGAMLNNSIVRRDLFYLLTMFVGCEPIIKLRRDRLDVLYNDLSANEIAHRLATTASFLRARDFYVEEEVKGKDDDTQKWARKLRGQHCGTLQEDVSSGKTIPLDLREACNKIIHASEYRFDVVGEDMASSYIVPTLYLYGSHRRVRWRVVLDVLRYIEIGMDYTEFS